MSHRKRRSAVFQRRECEDDPTDPEAYESAEDRVLANLELADKLYASWITGAGAPDSDDMARVVRHWARRLRHELKARRDPWSIADCAMTLARCWRDLEANEALHDPLDGKRRSSAALPLAQKNAARKNRKITLRKYKAAYRRARSRKELASLLKCSLQAVRNFERDNNINKNTGSSR